jgi:hypothetical protein
LFGDFGLDKGLNSLSNERNEPGGFELVFAFHFEFELKPLSSDDQSGSEIMEN